MTVPLACVFLAFVVTMLTKAPVAVAQLRQPGGYDNRLPRDQQAGLSGWGRRALGAHLNAFEAFPAFAAAVLVAHLAGADPAWSTGLAVTISTYVCASFCSVSSCEYSLPVELPGASSMR